MHLTYAIMLAMVVHENMKLGDNTLNKYPEISAKILANYSASFTASQYINNLETNRSYKRRVKLKNLKFFKKSIERFKKFFG